MRTKFLTLVALLVAGAVRADVVIDEKQSLPTGGPSTQTGTTAERTLANSSDKNTFTFDRLPSPSSEANTTKSPATAYTAKEYNTEAIVRAAAANGFPKSLASSSSNFRFPLSAVPEPGTMLLGGIAAAVGGAGGWWKRRKQRRAAAEAAATPA